jgi:hypothetical protein
MDRPFAVPMLVRICRYRIRGSAGNGSLRRDGWPSASGDAQSDGPEVTLERVAGRAVDVLTSSSDHDRETVLK